VGELLVVDVYERESRVLDALRSLEVRFVRRALPLGDYQTSGILVERKSVRDFHLAVIQRRLWRQLARLQNAPLHARLLVEGDDIDAGPLSANAARGALLAVAELGIPVIRSVGPADTALWLKLLTERPARRARRYAPARPRLLSPPAAMLSSVPGISVATAGALLTRYGSVAQIAKSDPSTWLSVPGVGPARAAALYKALHQPPASAT
jgi:ERCC4-type nuclease